MGGISNTYIQPGSKVNIFIFFNYKTKVLYLGGASGTTVSHVADIVGPEGCVYAVEFSHRSGRDLVNMAKKRINVIPIGMNLNNLKIFQNSCRCQKAIRIQIYRRNGRCCLR